MSPYVKHFILPSVGCLLALSAILFGGHSWFSYREVLTLLPLGLLAIVALVGAYLMQYAYLYSAALIGSVYVVIQWHLQITLADSVTYLIFIWTNLLFPLLLLAVVMLSGKRLLSIWGGVISLALLGFVILPFYFGQLPAARIIGQLPALLFVPSGLSASLPLGLWLSYVPVGIFLALLYFLNPTRLQAFWLSALLAQLAIFLNFSVPFISAIVTTLLATLLVIGLLQTAYELAFIDELTGIPGRKALEKRLLNLGRRYCIAMLDVDHFKKFNDTYGHDVGDQVLRMVAAHIAKVAGGGKAFRYGGEEFTILFPGKNMAQAHLHVERVRQAIANYEMQLRDQSRPADPKQGKPLRAGNKSQSVSVTISIGIAQRTDNVSEPNLVVQQADKALYAAKKAGRNCVRGFKVG